MTPMARRMSQAAFRARTVAIAAVLSCLAASVAAQDTTGVGLLSGVVVDGDGRPVEGVRVCALDTAACATSDATGAFRMDDLRAGAYDREAGAWL